MRRSSLSLLTLLLFLSDAQACGWKGRLGGRHRRPVHCIQAVHQPHPTYQPRPIPAPAAYSPPATFGSQPLAAPQAFAAPMPVSSPPPVAWTPAPPPQAAPVAQPLHDYTAAATGERQAYYYSYDDSGNLIIKQWMDFLFRGGKEAGMPRPPLPIIGRLQRN